MTTMRTLQKLLFGETWLLPIGIAIVIILAALVIRPLNRHLWTDLGGFVLRIRRPRVNVAGPGVASFAAIAHPREGGARERLSSTCSHTRAGRLGVGGCAGGGCRRRTR
jgi:hypothetical protein